jgi:ketosteroid isomerase-like protein
MKFKLLLLGVAIAIAVTGTGARADTQSNDGAAIRTLYQQFAADFRHKDTDAIMSLYVHDNTLFVFDVTTPRQHVGWGDYRADWKETFASMKGTPAFAIGALSVTVSGDVAYTSSIQTVTGNMGKLHALAVRVTDVLRKVNGKWLIVQEHVSVPIDFNTLKPDFMSRP